MNDYSIDLETLSTRFDAPILSIGVAQFSRDSGKIGSTFYREVKIESAVQYGVVNGGTIAWWMGQSDAAKRIFQGEDKKVTLPQALLDLSKFLPPAAVVWGNGATMDITVLEYAIAKMGSKVPWDFWNIRDMRTVVDIAGYRKGDVVFTGVPHNALDDAKHQAEVISHCIGKLSRKTPGKAKVVHTDEDDGLL